MFISVINPTILQNDTVVCPNTTLSLTLQNTQINKTVKWSTGDTTSIIKVKPIVNTTYWASVSDGYETCTDSIKIGVTNVDTSLGYVGKTSMCIGDSIIFFGGLSASSYQWLKNNSPITGANTQKLIIKTAGNYRVLVTNTNGCSDTSRSITVTVNSLPTTPIITSVGATTICLGTSVTLNSNASSANQWFLNGNVIVGANSSTYTATSSGYYTVISSNANGCYSLVSNTDTVTVNLLPSGNIQPITQNYICDGNSIILKTGGNFKFQWQNNNTPIIGATDSNYTAFIGGNYSVQYTTAFGCTSISTNSLNITLIKKPIIDFSFTARCINQPIIFQNLSDSSKSGAVNWLWRLGNGVTSPLFNPTFTYSNANTYLISLIGTNISCSSLSDSVSKQLVLEQNPAPITYPVIDAKIQSPIQLQARNIGTSFNWNPSTGLSNPNISNPLATLNNQQLYKVVITDNAGCNVVDTQLVRIFNGYDVFVPSGFSPDGDHVNDILRPILIGIKNINYFKVFNRWGQLIFETNQMNNGWDGTYLSKPQPSETYIWMIEAVDLNDKIIDKSGKSTLIR
jgi:gliding motility-associated-like protein